MPPAPRLVLCALAAALLPACAPTIRAPLKQALPSVFGDGAAAGPCLGEPHTLALGRPIVGAAPADLDGDGRRDLAFAAGGSGGGEVVFALHDGQGGLRVATRVPIPQGPTAIAAGDFDRDGHDDLALAADGPPALHVLLGRGRGEFIAGAIPLRRPASALFVADLDRDGAPDLLALDRRGGAVQALLGDGRGEFAQGPRSRLPAEVPPAALTLADVDRDGALDLALLPVDRRDALVHLVRGDGKGGFHKLVQRRAVGLGGRALLAAPLGGDEGHDLLALVDGAGGSNGAPVAVVLTGTGPLEYSAVGYFAPGPVADATLADLDADGDLDLVATSARDPAVFTAPGDGRGGFDRGRARPVETAGGSLLVLDAGGRPLVLVFADGSEQARAFPVERCAGP